MAKIGNEARLILSLAKERMEAFRKEAVSQTWPSRDCAVSEEVLMKQVAARAKAEGVVKGIDQYEATLTNIVLEIEERR